MLWVLRDSLLGHQAMVRILPLQECGDIVRRWPGVKLKLVWLISANGSKGSIFIDFAMQYAPVSQKSQP